jgi:hypothetical protein
VASEALNFVRKSDRLSGAFSADNSTAMAAWSELNFLFHSLESASLGLQYNSALSSLPIVH